MLPKKFNFTNLEILDKTTILSGEIGSGKTSFIVKLLYELIQIEDFDKKIVFINVDGFDFEKFNKLAKDFKKDTVFKWLDMTHFMAFSEDERESYTRHNSSGEGKIREGVEADLKDKYDYFDSLIVCDESDHYLTSINKKFSNFLKYRRHYSIGVIFLTQKFQNLNGDYYNSGAVNTFYRIRNPIFNLGNSKFLEHWSGANTLISENLLDYYSFKINPEIYKLYDVGGNIKSGNYIKKKLLIPILVLLIILPISYFALSGVVTGHMQTDSSSESVTLQDKHLDDNQNKKIVAPEDNSELLLIRCTTFYNKTNCYYKDLIESHNISYIASLLKSKILTLEYNHEYKHITFLKLKQSDLKYLFFKESEIDKQKEQKKEGIL